MNRAILVALLMVSPVVAQGPRYVDARRTVEGWYSKFLGRPADPAAEAWVQALRNGQQPEQVLSGILGSDEYYNRAGGTPGAFVQRMYEEVAGRRPTPREMDYWAGRVQTRRRDDVSYDFLMLQGPGRDDRERWRERHDFRRPLLPYR
jgi:hypothetical protein